MRTRFVLFIFIFMLSSVSLFSQYILYKKDSLSLPEYRLDDVTIRATKETNRMRELPSSISVINSQIFDRTQTNSLKDLTSVVPNFYMPEYGSKLTSPVYIRGIGSRINSPSVGLYVDNAPYFEKSAFDFDFFEIERVEVLRGPQGTLYGRNTMGGIINVFTRSPFREQGTRVVLSGGSYGNIKANATHYIKAGRRAAFSLGGGINRHNGYFTNTFTGEKADKLQSYSGRIRSEVYITESLKSEFVVNYEYSSQGGYPYMVYHDTLVDPAVGYDSYSYYKRNMLANSLVLKYDMKNILLVSTSTWHYFDDMQAIDQDFTPASLFFVTQDQNQHMFSNELILKPAYESRYNWVFGAFLFRQSLKKDVRLAYGEDGVARYRLPGPTETLKIYDTPTTGAALFHQTTIKDLFARGLYLTAGLRLDYERSLLDYEYFRTISGNTTLLSEFESDLSFTEVIPRIALGYNLNESSNVYLTLSKGYKTGGFNSTFEREEDRSFEPEKSWNYELGLKSVLFNNRIYGDMAFFYIDWRNQQIYQTVPSGQGSMLKNAGRSVSRGVEFSVTALLPLDTEVNISYGLTDAKFTSHTVNATTDYTGNKIPFVPASTFAGSVTRTFSFSDGFINSLSMGIDYRGTGRIYWNEANSSSQDYYGVTGGRIALSKGPVTLDIWGKNLFNTVYHAFRFNALGNSYVQNGRPTVAGANLRFRF